MQIRNTHTHAEKEKEREREGERILLEQHDTIPSPLAWPPSLLVHYTHTWDVV